MKQNVADEYYLQERKARKAEADRVTAIVRLQEKEKNDKYIMRWVRDPEDHTLWRWLPIKPRKRIK